MRESLEYLDTLSLANASTDYKLTNGIPNDYAMVGLNLTVSFRVVIGVHATATPFFLSPSTFIERITVQGQLAGKGNVIVFDMTGRQAFQYARLMMGLYSHMDADNFITGAGATGTYDVRFDIPIFFTAAGLPVAKNLTLLPGNMFANPLNLTVRRGVATCLGNTDTGTTQTFTAYGSGSGSPSVDVHRIVVKQGLQRQRNIPLLCTKTRQGPFAVAANLTDGLIARLNTGNLIGRIFFQFGTQDTTTVNELASGSNSICTRLRLKQNSQVIRDSLFFGLHTQGVYRRGIDTLGALGLNVATAMTGLTTGRVPLENAGEALLDFIPGGDLDDALNTVMWQAQGNNLFVTGDIVGAANQVMEVVTEEYQRIN